MAERSAEEGTWDLSRNCRQCLRLPAALSAHRQLKIHVPCSEARNSTVSHRAVVWTLETLRS